MTHDIKPCGQTVQWQVSLQKTVIRCPKYLAGSTPIKFMVLQLKGFFTQLQELSECYALFLALETKSRLCALTVRHKFDFLEIVLICEIFLMME